MKLHDEVKGLTRFWNAHTLSDNYGRNLWPSDIALARKKFSGRDDNMCKIMFKCHLHDAVMGRKRFWNAQSLSADCGLYLGPSDMLLTRYTLSCRDDHLCHKISNSHPA